MRVLVFETSADGHRFPYLRLLLPSLADVADTVTLALPAKTVDTDAYRTQIAPLSDRITIDATMPWSAGRALSGSFHKPALVHQWTRKHNTDHLIVPHADGLAQALGARRGLRPCPWANGVSAEALVMRGAFAYPESSRVRRLKHRLSWKLVQRSPFDILHHLDPIVFEHIRSQPGQSRWSLLPDPVQTPRPSDAWSARSLLGLPQDGRLISLVGAIDGRKGADVLIRAFIHAGLGDDHRLLLAGKVRPSIQQLLHTHAADALARGQIIVMDRFISDEELDAANVAADVVAAPYPAHIGSASSVIRAAAAHRPVLGSDYGWIGWTVRKFGLGTVVDVNNVDAFADALRQALDSAPAFEPSPAARAFVRFHSPENFAASWTAGTRQRMNLQPSPVLMTWPEVLAVAEKPLPQAG